MTAKPQLNPELLAMARQIAPEAVRMQALDRKLAQVRLSHVYAVNPGWEMEELARAEGMCRVTTADALAHDLGKGEDCTLLVHATACASLEMLKSLLSHATACSTVFYEYEV
jgi:hypothetical protein